MKAISKFKLILLVSSLSLLIGIAFLLSGTKVKALAYLGWIINNLSFIFMGFAVINIFYLFCINNYRKNNNNLYILYLFSHVIKWFVTNYVQIRFMEFKIAITTKPPIALINSLKIIILLIVITWLIFLNSISGFLWGLSYVFNDQIKISIIISTIFGIICVIFLTILVVLFVLYIKLFDKLILIRNDVIYKGDILEKALKKKFFSVK
ncbi:hypothetical protein [Mycoplasmopsis alligatoris]|uniref:hypothetical protein n=1 Tax=Mycoplasmopsis alligatoris TaxID=47687 RepID=UPI00030A434C|nr:hypothetical protein [Mycoplasmopsis alligatoris]